MCFYFICYFSNDFTTTFLQGLAKVFVEIILTVEHRYCKKHHCDNYKNVFRGLEYKKRMWLVASATIESTFNLAMQKLKKLDPNAHEWMASKGLKCWCKAFFPIILKYNAITNNISESLNSMIKPARDILLLSMFE